MEQVARTPYQIAAAVRRERRLRKMTQAELSKKINLRQATISQFEKGEEGSSLQTLLDILAGLNLEIVIRPRTKSSPKDIEQIF
jgi:HTH-type transcriptional regulator / antitoxin HipB